MESMSKAIDYYPLQNTWLRLWVDILDVVKKSATDAFKTASKKPIQKPVASIGNLVWNKIAQKIT